MPILNNLYIFFILDNQSKLVIQSNSSFSDESRKVEYTSIAKLLHKKAILRTEYKWARH